MANIVSQNPLVLSISGAITGLPPKIMVASVVYSGGSLAGHRCLLLERVGGRVVADIRIPAANETVQIIVNNIYDGLHLDVLNSGVCYVYLE